MERHFGFFGTLVKGNNPWSSEITRKELGWEAKQKGLIAHMEANYI